MHSTCPGDVCEAAYNERGAILRADDGDIFLPKTGNSNYNCSNHSAYCLGNDCHVCKCKTQQDTWVDSDQSCKNINSK